MIENPSAFWDVPDTDADARPLAFQLAPQGRRVLYIAKGSYRDAVISGFFVIANVPRPFSTYGDKQRVEVECLWYNRKTPENWPRVTIIEHATEVPGYTGYVITNIEGTKRRSRRR